MDSRKQDLSNYRLSQADIAKEIGVSEKTIEREMKKTDKVVYVGSGYF